MSKIRIAFILLLGMAIGLLFGRTDVGRELRSDAVDGGVRAAGSLLGATPGRNLEGIREPALLESGERQLACHRADWAGYGHPEDSVARQPSLDGYAARAVAPQVLVQERLEYLGRMIEARARQLEAEGGSRTR